MVYLPRGISPELLLSQVKNTMPYLFDVKERHSALGQFTPSCVLRELDSDPTRTLDHFEYFRLCLSAHYLTCATPVPTDVDNQIRRKLWPAHLPLEVALQMAHLVVESRHWDFTQVSSRFTYGAPPCQKEVLGGHQGEWFTVACAAYCALGHYAEPVAKEMRNRLFEEIRNEVHRHSEIFGSLWRAKEGVLCLKAAANIAHNLGDLDRVMDLWDLFVGDPLRLEFYKLGVRPFDSNGKLRYLGRLWIAGELYKSEIQGSSMALENHRHFALRKPRCLRTNREYLIPNGPFFDDWGKKVASSEDILEVVDALKYGWIRLPKTVGYGRALYGIFEALPHLEELRPDSSYSSIPKISQEAFERAWSEEALKWMDEIPSRAQ